MVNQRRSGNHVGRSRLWVRSALLLATVSAVTLTAGISSAVVTPTSGNVTISAVGDMDLGNTPVLPPNPTAYLLPIKAAIAAPIAFGNLEGTLTNSGSDSKCSAGSTECYAFRNPPSFAFAYKASGFTVLNSANNHSHDFGSQGVIDTSKALKAAGIVQAGLPGQIGLVHVGTTTVAFLDFAPYSSTNDMLHVSTAISLIHEAKTLYKATVIVVYMHSGAEGASADHVTGKTEYYYGENRGNPKLFAETMVDNGASLVIASGPHVLRGMEIYKGHLIAYSLGNFSSYKDFATTGVLSMSGILRVTLSRSGAYLSARFLSVHLAPDGQASLDGSGAAARFVAQLSREDFGARAPGIAANGTLVPPKGSVP